MFVDRIEHVGRLEQHLTHLARDHTYFRVVEIVGIGGVGKSSLLRHVRERFVDRGWRPMVLWIPLDSGATPIDVATLLAIRNQLPFECCLFDLAVLHYWSSSGQAVVPPRGSRLARSLAFQTVEAIGDVAGMPLPITLATDVYRRIMSATDKARRYDRADFSTIERLRENPRELRERLPHFLAKDVNSTVQTDPAPVVVFIDAYDQQGPEEVRDRAQWLQEFVGTLGRGVHVITTRHPVDWRGEWPRHVETVYLEELPPAEAKELVRLRLGSIPEPHVDRILAASGRVPFFLEASIACYRRLDRTTVLDAAQLIPSDQHSTLRTLLGHLPPEHRQLAIALAAVQFFDRALFEGVIEALNISVPFGRFDEVTSWFAVAEVLPGFYATHDLLTQFVRRSPDLRSQRLQALDAVGRLLHQRVTAEAQSTAAVTASILGGLTLGWASLEEMSTTSAETLVDTYYRMYDAGHWGEFPKADQLRLTDQPPSSSHPVRVAAEFFAALVARRIHGVDRALVQLKEVEGRRELLGHHAASVELEIGYLSELAGNYGRARTEFSALNARIGRIDPSNRVQVRVRLYHADMLIMDGMFSEGARLLAETYEQEVLNRNDYVEFVRHRGHAFRFSALPEHAASIYARALAMVDQESGLAAKLHTNLAEAYSWFDSAAALDQAELSMDLNRRYGNTIEIAKGLAAKAVAFARNQDVIAARSAVSESARLARSVGYRAGEAFALQAAALAEHLAGREEEAESLRRSLQGIVHNIGTYHHLALLTGSSQTAIAGDIRKSFGWIEPEGVEQRIRRCLTP